MKCCLLVFALVLGLGTAATAATIVMVPDQPVYSVGDTVTITFTGDGQGGSAASVYALFGYDPSILLANPSLPPVIFPGDGLLGCGGGLCEAFDQTIPFPSSSLLVNAISFTAVAPGTTNLVWVELDFFGLTNAPGTTVTVVPEPASAALLALGLFALGMRPRDP